MKKNTLIEIILGTVGGVVTTIGMCMCLVDEWDMMKNGIIVGIIGIFILLCIYPVYRKSHSSYNKQINRSLLVAIIIGIIGALVMGFGMSKCLIDSTESDMILGIIVGTIGLLVCVLDCPIYLYMKKS